MKKEQDSKAQIPKTQSCDMSLCYNQLALQQEDLDRAFDLLFEATIKIKS